MKVLVCGNSFESHPNPILLHAQDVNDVITAIDHVINMGLADPSKIAVLGGSHGGFLTTHLIGQVPDSTEPSFAVIVF